MNLLPRPARIQASAPVRPPAGAATLSIVMVLFLILAMVAAYANRNLIFEQRVSVNNYRGTVAMDSAEAGVEWALALLNGGLIDGTCVAGAAGANDFRTRYLTQKSDGSYTIRSWSNVGIATPLAAACGLAGGGGWTCSCPTSGAPTPVATAGQPAFRVDFKPTSAPGVVQLSVRGCANYGAGSTSCASQGINPPVNVDALATVNIALGLVRALPTAPIAALTAGGSVTQTGGSMTLTNNDANTAVALHTGSTVSVPTLQLAGPAGSTASASLVTDTTLRNQATGGRFFEALFGADRTTYRQQPAAARVDCTTACTLAAGGALINALNANPGRVVWVDGNVDLTAALPAASATIPLMLVVDGDLTVSAAQSFTGFVYANNVTLSAGGGAGWTQQGALVVAGDFVANANPTVISYDAVAMRQIAMGYGSFVRVPGSWQP